MKKTILTTIASLLAVGAFAQGSVTFQNSTATAGWPATVDRNVKFAASAAAFNPLLVEGANVSSNYAGVNLSSLRAALYFAPGTVSDANFALVNTLATPVSGLATATFKGSTSTTAGSWFGGTRTMAGIPLQSGAASLMVVVWDTNFGNDPFAPAAQGGLWGRSTVFSYTTPAGGTPAPAEFLPLNLASFSIGIVPEPSSMALAGLGAASLLLFRRRK